MTDKQMLLGVLGLVCSLLIALARPEEMSIMADCSTPLNDVRSDFALSSNWSCDEGFKTIFHTTNDIVAPAGALDKEVTTRLSKPQTVLNVFVLTEANVYEGKLRTGTSYIWVGSNTTPFSGSPAVTQVSRAIFDSGFYKLTVPTQGQDIVFRRIGGPSKGYTDIQFLLYELRAYQVPNLLLELEATATATISAPAPTSPEWAATNLIQNMSSRSSTSAQPPVTDGNGSKASYQSCYKTDSTILASNANKMELTINLMRTFFQHAVIFVQDLDSGWWPFEGSILLENVRIYIGDFDDYTKNVECAGGPFMVAGDPKNPKSYQTVTYGPPQSTTNDVWRFGKEVWCNLPGQYLTLVSDMTHKAYQSFTISLCQLAVFGTIYERKVPVPSIIVVFYCVQTTLEVEKIAASAAFAIGNSLNITLRQKAGSALAWVTFTQDTSSSVTKVNFAPDISVAAGAYEVILESYDQNSKAQSALKVDTITVNLQPSPEGCPSPTFNTQAPVVLVKEYLPTIYFPNSVFVGAHSYSESVCSGTFTQSITIDPPVTGVATNQRLQPIVAIGPAATAGSSFTVTFSGRCELSPTSSNISASFKQTYQLKTVFSTEFLDQPRIIHSLTAADLTFNVPPSAVGVAAPLQFLAASSFFIEYPIKTATFDSLGNTPPAIVPVPYAGFATTDIIKSQPSLGTTSLLTPKGVLQIQGAGYIGNLATGSVTFTCDAWTLAKQGTSVAMTLTFVNTVEPAFMASLSVRCSYEAPTAPMFAETLSNLVITASVAKTWKLPSVILGQFPLKQIRFEPDSSLGSFLTFDERAREVAYSGNDSLSVLFGDKLKIKYTLVDEQGIESPFEQTVGVCPVTSSDIDALAMLLSAEPLSLSLTAGKAATTQLNYRSKYDKLVEFVRYNDQKQQICGAVTVELVTKHPFLAHQPESKTLILTASQTTEPDYFEDSYLLVKLSSYSFKMPVRVQFTKCTVTRLSFEPSMLGLEYEVGSGNQQLDLPSLVQKPDCGRQFEKLVIKTIQSAQISPQIVSTAVKLDQPKKAILVATYDELFVGKNVTVVVAVETSEIDQKSDLQVQIRFSKLSVTKPTETNQAQTQSEKAPPLSQPNVKSSNTTAATAQEAVDAKRVVTLEVDKNLGASLGIPDLEVPKVTAEQAAIVKTPVGQLSTAQLFEQVPLAARLTAGVDRVNDLRLAQRDALKKQIADAQAVSKPRLPEARFRSFSALGELKFRFTKSLGFPKNITQTIRAQNSYRRLETKGKTYFEIFAVPGETADGETFEPIMRRWELVSLDPEGVEFKIYFFKPLNVSAGSKPDHLMVQMMLSEFTDGNGNSLPTSFVKMLIIPRQFASEDEAQMVDQVGDSGQSLLLSNLLLNLVTASSASQVWSIVNNVQVVLMIRLFDVQTPANVNEFNAFFAEVTSLQGLSIASREVVDLLFYLPEQDPKSANFQNAGYDSPFFVQNAREMLVVKFFFLCLPLLSVFLWFPAKCCDRAAVLRQKLHDKLFWNTYIRLLMESYADLTLLAIYNTSEMEWPDNDTTSVTANNWLTILAIAYLTIIPVLLFYVFWKNYSLHVTQNERFKRRFGAFFLDTARDSGKKCSVLLAPVAYYVKRLSLSVTLVFWSDFLMGQIAIQFIVSIATVIWLQTGRPYHLSCTNNLETFNEVTTWLILYFVMLFSPFVADPVTCNAIGIAYIATLGFSTAFHIFLLFKGAFEGLKVMLRLKRCLYHRKWCGWCFTATFGCFRGTAAEQVPNVPILAAVANTAEQPSAAQVPDSQVSALNGVLGPISEASERFEQSDRAQSQPPVVAKKKKRANKKKKSKRKKGKKGRRGRAQGPSQTLAGQQNMLVEPDEPISLPQQDSRSLQLEEVSDSSGEYASSNGSNENSPSELSEQEEVKGAPFVEDQLKDAFSDYYAKYHPGVPEQSDSRFVSNPDFSDDSDFNDAGQRPAVTTLVKTKPDRKQIWLGLPNTAVFPSMSSRVHEANQQPAIRRLTLEAGFERSEGSKR